jgi:hypothetical protein
VEHLQRGVGAALLVAVDVRRDPQDLGCGGLERVSLLGGEGRVAEGLGPVRIVWSASGVMRSLRPTTAYRRGRPCADVAAVSAITRPLAVATASRYWFD